MLALLPAHGGAVVQRVRRVDESDGPFETQILQVPDDAALASFMADPARLALSELRLSPFTGNDRRAAPPQRSRPLRGIT